MALIRRTILVILFTAFMFVFGSADKASVYAFDGSATSFGNIISSDAVKYRTASEVASENSARRKTTVGNIIGGYFVEENPASDNAENQKAQKTEDVKLTLSFAGDCTIGTDESFKYVNSFPEMLKRQNNNYSYFFSGVKQIFEKDDLTLVNLETTLTKAENKAEKKFRFKGKPDYVNILKTGSVEMVNISNNHIYDYLKQGFDETLKTLKAAGVAYSGEGNIAYFTVKDKKIASIGYSAWEMSITKKLRSDIQRARKNADLVIVSFHWGKERTYYPNSVQTGLGRLSIDEGADIVLGHHPHVLQGIELYKGRYIVYSLGNFCFGGNSNPSDKDSMIFHSEFTFREGKLIKCAGEIIPCSISSVSYVNDYKPVILSGTRGQKLLDRIYNYSGELKFGIKRGLHK